MRKNTQATARREGAVFLQFTRENFEMQVVKNLYRKKLENYCKPQEGTRSCLYISVHLEEVCGFRCLFYYNLISNIEFIQPMSTLWQQQVIMQGHM